MGVRSQDIIWKWRRYVLDISSLLLHTLLSMIATDSDRGREYCIGLTVYRFTNSSITELEVELWKSVIFIFSQFGKVANLIKILLLFITCLCLLLTWQPFSRLKVPLPEKCPNMDFVLVLIWTLFTLCWLIQTILMSRLLNSLDIKYDVAIVIVLAFLV